MRGVVSLLDDVTYSQVEGLWAELETRFDVRGVYVTPYPHFSYHIAPHYQTQLILEALAHISRTTAAFPVVTTGIAIFTGPSPVIYIPVAPSLALLTLHQAIYTAVQPFSQQASSYYTPNLWFPHIPVGFADITPRNLGPIVTWLNRQTFAWQITVNNLCFIDDRDGEQRLHTRWELQNESGGW